MHTEFVRERALPGQLIIGADSHSCSAGAVSCLSIGMGVADVVMPLITGQTWFTVPETVSIRFVGRPPLGIGGKDTILYILKEFKRNTIAAERVVEFSGPGLKYLSGDARFAIANMCTVSAHLISRPYRDKEGRSLGAVFLPCRLFINDSSI